MRSFSRFFIVSRSPTSSINNLARALFAVHTTSPGSAVWQRSRPDASWQTPRAFHGAASIKGLRQGLAAHTFAQSKPIYASSNHGRGHGRRSFSAAPLGDAFDWRQAIVLAGASFEAYFNLKEPVQLTDVATSGAHITYVDGDFLEHCMDGFLDVKLLQVTGIPTGEGWPGSKVYATVEIGGKTVGTKPLESGAREGTSALASLDTAAGKQGEEEEPPQLLFLGDLDKAGSMQLRLWRARLGWPLEELGSGEVALGDRLKGGSCTLDVSLKPTSQERKSQLTDGAGRKHVVAKDGTPHEEKDEGRIVTLCLTHLTFAEAEARQAAQPGTLLGSPSEQFQTNPWRGLQEAAAIQLHESAAPLAFIDHAETDTQVWLSWNREQRTLCIAFRGTEQGRWRDLLTDISLAPIHIDSMALRSLPPTRGLADTVQQTSRMSNLMSRLERVRTELETATRAPPAPAPGGTSEVSSTLKARLGVKAGSMVDNALTAVTGNPGELRELMDRLWQAVSDVEEAAEEQGTEDRTWVHQGFAEAYDSVRSAVLGLVHAAVQSEGGGEPWTVLVTGHSLGGALATLGAYDLALQDWGATPRPIITMYNFGSPRVGNRPFAKEYNDLVPNSWRVVNNQDAVCAVPRLMGYCHVGHAVRLLGQGKVEVQRDTSLASGEGTVMPDVMPAVAGMMAALVPDFTAKATSMVMAAIPALAERAGDAVDNLATAAQSQVSSSQPDPATVETNEQRAAAQKLWDDELDAWSALLDRAAITEHLEDLYLQSLSACLQETWAVAGELPASAQEANESKAVASQSS